MYISADSRYSRILNSINKRNLTAFAIAEVTESELEDDNLGLNKFWIVSSMVLTEDMKQVLFFIPRKELPKFEAIEKGVWGSETLMTWLTTKKVTLIDSVISAASWKGDETTYHLSSVSN